MEILNFKVVYLNGRFQQLVLCFLYNCIFAILENKNISSSKMNRTSPAICWNIKRMLRCRYYFFSICKHMNQFIRFINKCLNDFL